MRNWRRVTDAKTLAKYEERLENLAAGFDESEAIDKVQQAINYVNDTWIPHEDKFVRYWTNSVPHLDHNATSRVEGSQR